MLLRLCHCIILFLRIIFTKNISKKYQKASTRRALQPEGQYQKATYARRPLAKIHLCQKASTKRSPFHFLQKISIFFHSLGEIKFCGTLEIVPQSSTQVPPSSISKIFILVEPQN